jgi:FkbM family methyltransferase
MEITINAIKFWVNTNKHKVLFDYINDGLWEPETFKIFDYFTTKNSTVIDLGCWSGITSLYLANLTQTVYAIDADPICFSELKININLNPAIKNRIKPYNLAISNKKEIVKLYARENYGESSTSILERSRDKLTSIQVDAISLKDFIDNEKIQKVDFIKMDIEGAEFKILPTMGLALKKINFPTLYVSFHYNYLNENSYSKYIKSRILTKLLLKIESVFKVSFLKKSINKSLQNLFTELNNYQYIYTQNGNLISYIELMKKPDLIKNNELIFTNIKWNQ